MPTLGELQSLFRGAMFGAEMPQLVGAIAGDGLAPAARLQIYRHHVLTSLTEALQATFRWSVVWWTNGSSVTRLTRICDNTRPRRRASLSMAPISLPFS